jgi:hypothetical protein
MMAGYVIVYAFDQPPPEGLAEALELADRLQFVRGGERPDLWISWARFHEVEAHLAAALAAGQVGCATLLPGLPPPEQRWILTEWRGRLAVHASIADQLDPRFWADPSSYDLIDMRVFAPAGGTPDPSIAGPGVTPGVRLAEWVETRAEYLASVENDRPTLITVPAQQILTRMRDWFGDLADERVGGAIAVLAMSGITASTRTHVVLRSPAALGLRRLAGVTALPMLGRDGRIIAQAWGTRGDDPTRGLARPRPRYDRPESRTLKAGFNVLKTTTGARHGVLIRLTTGVATEVLVDTGLVFEQETLGRVQNLAIAAGAVVGVDAHQPASLALPAWCLNRRLAPPRGQPVRPTPLFLPLTAGISQGGVWNIVERSLNQPGGPS